MSGRCAGLCDCVRRNWLGDKDSNLDMQIQSLLSYR